MKSNATTTNYFTTFLQNVDLSSSYWFSSRITINITFLFTNNHSTHQHFVNIFVKKFVSLTLLLPVLKIILNLSKNNNGI